MLGIHAFDKIFNSYLVDVCSGKFRQQLRSDDVKIFFSITVQVRDDEIIRLIAMQFDWRGTKSKPLCSCFIGSSPEFEIAAYTICLLLDRDGRTDCKIGEYEVELTVHSFGRQRKLGSAYMSASKMK